MMRLGDPLLTDEHMDVLEIATKEEADEIKAKALKVNRSINWAFLQE